MRNVRYAIVVLLMLVGTAGQAEVPDEQLSAFGFVHDQAARFRLYPTRNMWNFIELDTATGRLWLVQFSVSDDLPARFVISTKFLANGTKPSRFDLYKTSNVWNYILVDQTDGRTWQVQFSIDKPSLTGIMRIKDAKSNRANTFDRFDPPQKPSSGIKWDAEPRSPTSDR